MTRTPHLLAALTAAGLVALPAASRAAIFTGTDDVVCNVRLYPTKDDPVPGTIKSGMTRGPAGYLVVVFAEPGTECSGSSTGIVRAFFYTRGATTLFDENITFSNIVLEKAVDYRPAELLAMYRKLARAAIDKTPVDWRCADVTEATGTEASPSEIVCSHVSFKR